MAVNYTIPNWIRGAQPAEKYVQGYGLGLQAAQLAAHHAMAQMQLQHQQAQLAQEAQLAQMRLNIAQQEQERRRAHDEQYLEVQKEYHKQQADLREMQLEEQKQKIGFQAEAAARKAAAIMGYQKDVATGTDPTQAALKWGSDLGTFASTALRMAHQPKPIVPGQDVPAGRYINPETGLPIEGWVNVPTASGRGTHPMKVGTGEMTYDQAIKLKNTLGLTNPGENPQNDAMMKLADAVIMKHLGGAKSTLGSPTDFPWDNPSKAVDGQPYNIQGGVGIWNAKDKNFKRVAGASNLAADNAAVQQEFPAPYEQEESPPEGEATEQGRDNQEEPDLFDEPQ